MKLSEASKELEEWLGEVTYDFVISEVQLNANDSYRFYINEYAPDYQNVLDEYFITIEPDGRMINSNGDDILEVFMDANINSDQKQWGDYATLEWLKEFEEKWYKKGVA